MTDNLPLPEPQGRIERRHRTSCAVYDPSPGRCDCGAWVSAFTASQMHAHAAAARAQALGEAAQWRDIETAPKDEEVFFWCMPRTIEDDHYLDTSGMPILSKRGGPYLHRGKRGSWSSLDKATHWMPLPPPPGAPK